MVHEVVNATIAIRVDGTRRKLSHRISGSAGLMVVLAIVGGEFWTSSCAAARPLHHHRSA